MATRVTSGNMRRAEASSHAGRGSLEREVFAGFPYALVVLDGRGRAVSANREARRLTESLGLAAEGLSCCELLGCRSEGSALARVCVTELALAKQQPLAEMRLFVGEPRAACPMWVAAAPIATSAVPRVLLQLRPARGVERAATTAQPRAKLRVATLGRTVVESEQGAIAGPWLEQRPGQLLKYLVAERRRAVSIDEIAESIWSQADYGVGASVRYYVHALRRRIEPQRGAREPSAFISVSAGTYSLRLDNVEVDADEFEARMTAGLALVERDQAAGAREIEHGLALYRGEFLAELPYAEWAMAERHRLHDLACVGLRRLAEVRERLRLIDGAARCLERLAALQPYDEDVHRRLMEFDIMRGRRSDAVRRYATLRSRLRRTFGHDPNFTPADLSRRID